MEPACADGLDGGHSFQATSSSQAVPYQALGTVHLDMAHVSEYLLDCLHLCHISHQRACGVCVDVVYLHMCISRLQQQRSIRLLVPFTLMWLASVATVMAFISAAFPTSMLVACILMYFIAEYLQNLT